MLEVTMRYLNINSRVSLVCQSNSDRATRHCRIITSVDYCTIYEVPWPYKVHYTTQSFITSSYLGVHPGRILICSLGVTRDVNDRSALKHWYRSQTGTIEIFKNGRDIFCWFYFSRYKYFLDQVSIVFIPATNKRSEFIPLRKVIVLGLAFISDVINLNSVSVVIIENSFPSRRSCSKLFCSKLNSLT